MKPLVSIIIPCHNAGSYVQEAIQSALNQSYKPIEIIVVDDGSTDDSAKIAQSFGKQVVFYQQPQSGPGKARNYGVQQAKGEYIAFLDADDLLDPAFIHDSLTALRSTAQGAYTYSRMQKFGKQSGLAETIPFDAGFLVRRSNFVGIGVVMPKSLFQSVGGFDEHLTAFEDWDLWLKLLSKGHHGTLIDKPLYKWRFHTSETRNQLNSTRLHQLRRQIWSRHWLLVMRYFPKYYVVRLLNRVRRLAGGNHA